MSRSTRHAVAVVALALAGLVVAVVLGVVVSRAASQNVALGSADLGSGRHLVVTTTTTRTVTTPPPATSAPTVTTGGGDDHHGGGGDHDRDRDD